MTTVTNNSRNPAIVHTKSGAKTILPGGSIDDEFTDEEIKAMSGHPDYEVDGKKAKGKKDDKTVPGLPGLGNVAED